MGAIIGCGIDVVNGRSGTNTGICGSSLVLVGYGIIDSTGAGGKFGGKFGVVSGKCICGLCG